VSPRVGESGIALPAPPGRATGLPASIVRRPGTAASLFWARIRERGRWIFRGHKRLACEPAPEGHTSEPLVATENSPPHLQYQSCTLGGRAPWPNPPGRVNRLREGEDWSGCLAERGLPMRRLLPVLALLAVAGPVQARGLLIPTEKKVPPLAMLRHHVTVAIEDQVAVTR